MNAADVSSEAVYRSALRKLVAEIYAAEFRDGRGHSLKHNTAFLEAAALLELQEVLERASPGRG